MDKKTKILRDELESRLTIFSTDQPVSDYDNIISDLPDKIKNSEISQFYEKWPYHKSPPIIDLKNQLSNLEADWENWIIPVTPRQKRTLDAGCGCGYNLALLSKLASVSVGVDISLNSLHLARKYLNMNNIEEKTYLIHGDICTLDLPQASFDLITCIGVLHHIPDHLAALKNMSRLLDKNGVLLLGIYHPGGRFWHRFKRRIFHSVWNGETEKKVKWTKRLFPVKQEAERYNIPEEIYVMDSYFAPVEKAFSAGYLRKILNRIDLELLQIRPSPSIGFRDKIECYAMLNSGAGDPDIQLNTRLIDKELERLRQHHYWCLIQKKNR